MKDYLAPLTDMQFALSALADIKSVAALPCFEDCTEDTVQAVLEEAAKFARGVLSPLNRVGDAHGAALTAGEVTTAPGWKSAYMQFNAGGWGALSIPEAQGGMGLPRAVAAVVDEMWNGANLAFALCPMLTRGAIEALLLRGSESLKSLYLPRLVSGEWAGTMNLTEPQAGSDLAALRTRAEPAADGSYRLFGQKIYITYGEHDLTDNIIHMVLARTPNAPPGVKGISLFLVPKVLVKPDGSLGARNDVRCVSIEHKLGIHGSPTCVLSYGDADGAVGYLVGEENRGLEIMFIMMNAARFGVGIEGLALAERAYQMARDYALERVQGAAVGETVAGPIIRHPDVRRLLMSMKSQVEAMRALALVVAAAMDLGEYHPNPAVRAQQQSFALLMIPVVKGWTTESAFEIASLAMQVHGGMGYVEETGIAQILRDSRITSIYEGTTAIQANDLLNRKIIRDQGAALFQVVSAIEATADELKTLQCPQCDAIANRLALTTVALQDAAKFLIARYPHAPREAFAGSVPMLKLLGLSAGGWQLGRAAAISRRYLTQGTGPTDFYQAKLLTARFYADHMLSQTPGLASSIIEGSAAVLGLADEQFQDTR